MNHSANEDEGLIYEPNTTQVPNVIFDFWMNRLSETQFKCLLVVARKTLGWHKRKDKISISQISELTGFKDRAIQYSLNELIEMGLVKKTLNKKSNGDADANSYELNIKELAKKKHIPPTPKKKKKVGGVVHPDAPGVVHPDAPVVVHADAPTKQLSAKQNSDKPIIYKNSDITEIEENLPSLPVIPASSLPFSKEKKGEQASLKKDKPNWAAKLSPEEKEFHDMAISYVPTQGDKLESSFITAQLKKHGLAKMKQAYQFCLHSIKKHGLKKSLGGMFRTALEKGLKAPDKNFDNNKKYTLQVKQHYKEFNVTETYVSLPEMSWDLPYSMPHESFKAQILQKVEYLRNR